MALLSEYGKHENDPGKLFQFGVDDGKPVRLRLRRIPVSVELRLSKAHGNDKTLVKASGWEIDALKNAALARDRASFALMESENLSVWIGDEQARATYAKLTGSEESPKVGEDLTLDPFWNIDGRRNDALRDHVLREHPSLVEFVLEQVGDEKNLVDREEDAQAKT